MMRSGTKEVEEETEKRIAIPITVRQLEAIVRISESLAKMELQPFVVDRHVEESLRLFQVIAQLIGESCYVTQRVRFLDVTEESTSYMSLICSRFLH